MKSGDSLLAILGLGLMHKVTLSISSGFAVQIFLKSSQIYWGRLPHLFMLAPSSGCMISLSDNNSIHKVPKL